MRRLGFLSVASRLLGTALVALLMGGCTGSGSSEPVLAASSPQATSAPSATPGVASPASDSVRDFGHVKATSSAEVLDALSESGMKCDWVPLDPNPSTDEVINKCAKWGTYLWFSATGTGKDFVNAARDDPKLKGFAYMLGDHWVMIGKPKIIVEMSRSIGGDAGKF